MNFKTITKLMLAACAMLNMHNALSAANNNRVTLYEEAGMRIQFHQVHDFTNQEYDRIFQYHITQDMDYQTPIDYLTNTQRVIEALDEIDQAFVRPAIQQNINQNLPTMQSRQHFITKLKKYAGIGFGAGFLAQRLIGNNSNCPKTIAMLQMIAPIASAHLYTTRVAIPNNDDLGYSRIVDTICPAIVGSAAGTLGALAWDWLTN